MKFVIASLLVLAVSAINGENLRTKRGILASPYVAEPYIASPYAPYAAYYAAPSFYSSPYIAAPNPVVARASRVVGAPGFAAKYYTAPYVAAPVAASPYTVLVR